MRSKKQDPIISVIMPTYNRANLLARAIDSVLVQSFNNFELIVVDDGSTDNTQDVLGRFDDKRLKVVQFAQNRGIGVARNEGILCATGSWISFLDSDDIWMPEKLANDISILERHSAIDFLFDNYRNVNHINKVDQAGFEQTHLAFRQLRTVELDTGVFSIQSGLPEALLVANLIGTPSIISIRRSVFTKIGGFRQDLGGTEDFEFVWRAALAGVLFAYHNKVLVERHKDADSVSANARVFIPHLLKAFDVCEISIHRYNRHELLVSIDQARKQAWLGLLYDRATKGPRVEAFNAFRQTLRFGFSTQAIVYLFAAMAGPHVIALTKRFKGI